MTNSSDPDDQLPPPFSEEEMALDFAQTYSGTARHVGKWGKWMIWDGRRWRADETYQGFNLARKTVRRFAFRANAPKEAKAIASAKTVAAIERLAKADPAIAEEVEVWDADPMLLNTPGGIVDLRTGAMSDHDPDALMTKVTAVAPGGDCPRWLTFLDQAMKGDADLVAFVQRMAGYMLTGDTSEHAIFFLHGQGGNGKGVFVETIAAIMADYHVKTSITTFTETHTDQHSTNIAGLVGARAVTASETEEGRRWAEAKIKELSGGDAIRARFMRQDEFTYVPQFKLLISGNHKPGLRSVDDAIRRRFHLIPFALRIPKEDRDTKLRVKLKEEWPGILAWMIEGCREWQRIGLAPPHAVVSATDEYLEAEDAIGHWLEERCEVGGDGSEASGRLFASWRNWAKMNNEWEGSQKRFSQKLEDRGYVLRKSNGLRKFFGLRLKPDSDGM